MKYKLEYFAGKTKCTDIIADFEKQIVSIQNYTDNNILRAFGVRQKPSWNEFIEFLGERSVPKSRDGLKYYLEAIGICEYEPFEIVKITKGKMAEDDQWIKITEI